MNQAHLLTIEELREYYTQKTTDYAYLMGAWQTEKSHVKYQISGPSFYDPEKDFIDSPRFSATVNNDGMVKSFWSRKRESWSLPTERDLTFSLKMSVYLATEKESVIMDEKMIPVKKDDNGDAFFLYGAYPQSITSRKDSETLEQAFQEHTLSKTGNSYTCYVSESSSARRKKNIEYKLNDKRYVRVIPDKLHFLHDSFTLSNDERICQGQPYWVEVAPLKWLLPCFGNQKDTLVKAEAYLSIAPMSGILYDRIPNFLRQFDKEVKQSHDFCVDCVLQKTSPKIVKKGIMIQQEFPFMEQRVKE